MNDRELLEKAAKVGAPEAPRHTKGWHYSKRGPRGEGMYAASDRTEHWFWNPLTDDGDALRLLANLPFRTLYVSKIGATVSWEKDGGPHRWKCGECASENGNDLNAATRRAIVRAAAAISEATKGSGGH